MVQNCKMAFPAPECQSLLEICQSIPGTPAEPTMRDRGKAGHISGNPLMKRYGTKRGRALLVDSELDIRRTISRYLQLHGMDVVEVNTLREAEGRLTGAEDFDLLVTELMTPQQADWNEWKELVNRDAKVSLLIHGSHADDWNEISGAIGRSAGFIGKPFSLSDFHWALHQLL